MFHLYGLFIGIAIVVGYSVAERLDERVGKIAPWVIGLGLIGARIYHVIDKWGYYSQNLIQIPAVWNGGLAIWGGIIGGLAAFEIINHKFANSQIDKWNILGAIVTALPLAQAIGRLGNAVNGEFYDIVWTMPWWAVEAILDLILFGILINLKKVSPQVKVLIYLAGYSLIRLVLNPFRIDLR
ncbi:MAG: prolipoprotein diacylglyceryl transferase family protein [bacterium]